MLSATQRDSLIALDRMSRAHRCGHSHCCFLTQMQPCRKSLTISRRLRARSVLAWSPDGTHVACVAGKEPLFRLACPSWVPASDLCR
jgi:hypothetical protein